MVGGSFLILPLFASSRLCVIPFLPHAKPQSRKELAGCGERPKVLHLAHNYDDEVDVTNAEMKRINQRLQRSKTLPKYDITIKPTKARGR